MKDPAGAGNKRVGTRSGVRGEPDGDRARRFEALYQTNMRPVLAYCLRRTDPDTALEVMSDTFLVAWRRFDDVPETPLPWLLATARRTLANARRSSRRQEALRDRLNGHRHMLLDPDGPEEAALRDDERARVHDALERLAPTDREILALTAWEGLSCAEVSEVLGIPAGRVSVRLHRAKKRLAREYGSRAKQVRADGGRRHDP